MDVVINIYSHICFNGCCYKYKLQILQIRLSIMNITIFEQYQIRKKDSEENLPFYVYITINKRVTHVFLYFNYYTIILFSPFLISASIQL